MTIKRVTMPPLDTCSWGVIIMCDYRGCENGYDYTSLRRHGIAYDPQVARDDAFEDDEWTCIDNADFCPDHRDWI